MFLRRRFEAAPTPWSPWLRTLARLVVGAAVVTLIVEALGFPDEPAAWAVVAVAVVVGDTTGQTVAASWNRVEGSVVGCLSGAVVQLGIPGVPLALRVVIAMALCLLACRVLRIGAGWRLGVALAGFFVFVPGIQEWQTVGWRLSATLLGIAAGLLAVLFVAPDTAAKRLRDGIRAALTSVARAVDDDLRSWFDGVTRDASAPAPNVAALRPLVADRRYEVSARGLRPDVASGVLDGLTLAAAGVERLDRHVLPGSGVGLNMHVADDLRRVAGAISAACAVAARSLADPSAHGPARADARLALQAVEGDLEDAIERLRAKGVTPDARAAELTALFGVVNALGLVATGLARVLDALGLPGGGSDAADR